MGELPALELLAVQAVASTAGKGLLLETRQLGPLVLALDDRRIAALQRHLASLAAMGDPRGADRDG